MTPATRPDPSGMGEAEVIDADPPDPRTMVANGWYDRSAADKASTLPANGWFDWSSPGDGQMLGLETVDPAIRESPGVIAAEPPNPSVVNGWYDWNAAGKAPIPSANSWYDWNSAGDGSGATVNGSDDWTTTGNQSMPILTGWHDTGVAGGPSTIAPNGACDWGSAGASSAMGVGGASGSWLSPTACIVPSTETEAGN